MLTSQEHSVDYAIDYLNAALSTKHYRIKNDDSQLAEMRHYLPYTLQETTTKGRYILLNRQYQLLGSDDDASIPIAKYDDYIDAHIGLTSVQLSLLRSNSHGLYSDTDAPWLSRKHAKAYLIRLQALHKIIKANTKVTYAILEPSTSLMSLNSAS